MPSLIRVLSQAENDCKMAALQECMQPVVEAVSTKNPSVKAASAVMQVGEAVGTAMKLVRLSDSSYCF